MKTKILLFFLLTIAPTAKQHSVRDFVAAGVGCAVNPIKVAPEAHLGQSRVKEPLVTRPHVGV